jgi:hypothetical protein
MMSLVQVRLLPRGQEVLVLGLGWNEEPVLKARLPSTPEHPRAVITVLEGLALWAGARLPVALGVAGRSAGLIDALLPQGAAWCSPLVELHPVEFPRARRRRLDGLGDFSELRQLRLPGIP